MPKLFLVGHGIIWFECLPLVAEVTWERTLVTVAEPDVDLQSCKRGAGHVTEGTLHLIYCVKEK